MVGGGLLCEVKKRDAGALEGIFYERRRGMYLQPEKKSVEKERLRLQKTENSRWGTRLREPQLGKQEKDGTRDKSWESGSWAGCRLSLPTQGKVLGVHFTIWLIKEKEHLLRKKSLLTLNVIVAQ